MTVLDRLRSDLAGHRAELLAEEKRMVGELEEIRQALAAIDKVLGGRKPAASDPARFPAGGGEDRDRLRALMIGHLQQAGTGGLTSYDLFDLIAPEWTGSELSVRRIGTNAANMPEVTGDGQRWYFVPAGDSLPGRP